MKHVLLVGRPGVGKTTLVKQLAQSLRHGPIDGFYTEKLREDGERLGVWLSTLDGRQVLLAHRQMDSPYRVGAYKINVTVLDEVAVSVIRRAMRQALILFVDEIGKMELCSKAFQHALEEAIVRGPRVVATGGIRHLPFLEALKRRRDVELIPLTEHNRKALLDELTVRFEALCDEDERVRSLQRQADRICEMIVSGEAAEIDLEIQQAKLRDVVARWFPDKQGLYQLLYESRFRRLWQQFRQE